MNTVPILVHAALIVCLSQVALAQTQSPDTPRTMEHPSATAERDAQLVTPAAQPPSWGPSLYAVPASEPAAARAKRPARADPDAAPKPADADSQRAPRQARTPRRAVDQVLTPTPRINGNAPTGKPVLSYGAVQNTAPPAAPAPAQGTVPATCTGSGCVDAGGQRLGTGVGNAAVTPQGQLCTKGVVGVQCF